MADGKSPILLLLALALLLGSAAAQTSSSQSGNKGKTVRKHRVADERAGTIIARAETALEKKDYPTAEKLLKEAVADDSQDYRAWFDLGFLYNALGQKAESIDAYRKSVAADPTVFESNLNLGLMLEQAHDPEAARYLRAATGLKPSGNVNEGQARAWLSLGHVLQANDPKGALAAFSEAAKLRPKDAEPHLSAGVLLEQQQQFDAAEKEYREATNDDPKSADALIGLVNIYQKSGRLPEAEAALRKYLAIAPGNATAHFQLGRVLVTQHKRYEAIDELEAGLKLSPADAAARRDLAALYDVAGKFDKAELGYRALLQINPKDASAHAGLGAVLLHAKKPAEAQNELVAALTLDPKLAEAYGDLALAASENKNYPLTIRALDERAKFVEDNAGTYFLRATAYDNLHDKKQAAENYRKFLQLANGRFPDQEWQARHRLVAIAPEKK